MTRRTIVRAVFWTPITLAAFVACTYYLITY